jgi:hypothetical protein
VFFPSWLGQLTHCSPVHSATTGTSSSGPLGSVPQSQSSITPLIQLKGDTANWNSVPQKAVSAHTPQPLYLTIMATLKQCCRSRSESGYFTTKSGSGSSSGSF